MTRTTLKTLTSPAGTTGLAVEPWTIGEIYAVAANWAQASSQVLTYGELGWVGTGKQVADYRHSDRAALAELLRETIAMGGDEPDDDEIDGYLDDATDIGDTLDVAAMADDAHWRHDDSITEYTACCYGRDGDEPGQVQVNLETADVDGVTLYRWVMRDDGGTHETGDATLDREAAIAAGMEYASENDETPDADEQIESILSAGWFASHVDAEKVGELVEYIHSCDDLGQGHVIIDRDGHREWVTTGYVERESVHVGIPHRGFGSWAGAADALLRAVSQDDDQ